MARRSPPFAASLAAACLAAAGLAGHAAGQGFHQRTPNAYKQTADDNAATALNARLAAGELELAVEPDRGRLRAVLAALGVPEASQMLVFSKTSLQRHRISPQNPRALYFGADAYVGWVPGGKALEVAVSDPRLGIAFYALSQDPAEAARLVRDDSCLSCHASTRTDDEPGLIVRSVFPDANGDPISSAGESTVIAMTPLAERWGGWFVTGAFTGPHRGNGIAARGDDDVWRVTPSAAADLTAFADRFAVDRYLARTSDVAALLVFEQQAALHDLLVRVTMQMRCLLESDRVVNDALGETGLRATSAKITDRLADDVAAALLLADETPLDDRAIRPDPAFAAVCADAWPRSPDGTRLGELDLRHRIFALPLSPMVHSRAFAALPDELRTRVLARLRAALRDGRLPDGVHATPAERKQLDGHLTATLPGYAP